MDKQYIDKDRVCRVVENVMDYIEEHNIISSTIIALIIDGTIK